MRFKVLLTLGVLLFLSGPWMGGFVGAYVAVRQNQSEAIQQPEQVAKPTPPPPVQPEPEPPKPLKDDLEPLPTDDEQTRKELESLRRFRAKMEAAKHAMPASVASDRPLSAYERGLEKEAEPDPEPELGPGWTRTRAQGCRLARMSANENTRVLRPESGGGTDTAFTEDTHGIAEVVKNNQYRLLARRHGFNRRVQNWEEVMGELSPHTNGVVECKPGKQHCWTRHLSCTASALDLKDADSAPEGWETARHGDWRIYGPRWPVFRDKVIQAWLSDSFIDVPGKPIGWGNEGDIARAIKRGMCVIPGLGDRNGFIAEPGNGCELEETEIALLE
jgi:hypothetical protein